MPAITAKAVASDIEIIRTFDALCALEEEWDELYQRAEPRNPFLSHAWTLACWMAERGDAAPFVATLRDCGRLIAVAPLCIERRSGFRILRFIADGRSDYLGFLCSGNSRQVERELLDALVRNSTDWDLGIFQQLTEAYTGIHAIKPLGLEIHSVAWTTAPYCASSNDWEALHVEGPSWLKRTRKRLRRFLKDGWEIQRFTGNEAAARLDQVARIETRSWKGREGATRLQPGPGQDLLRHAFEHDADGAMELWLASIAGEAVAFQIDFLLPDRLWIYQQAYDEDYKRTSVGSFMAYITFEAAWQRGVREYDYLSGEEPYKLERTNASRTIHHLAVHRRSGRGWLAYGLFVAPRWRLRNVRVVRQAYKAVQSLKRQLRHQSNA